MSRQPVPFTVPQPLASLNMEEIRFWLTIMREHAVFIKNGLPCNCTELRDEAQSFCEEFAVLLDRSEHVQSDKKFNAFIDDACGTIKDFYKFKRRLLDLILTCKIQGHNFPLFIDHMSREAEYVLLLLNQVKKGKNPLTAASKAQETLFWLRIMADHTKFILHLIDPSERTLLDTADDFVREFDDLYLEGRDFSSMLHLKKEVASFQRFLKDVRAAVVRLRNFKRAAHDMIVECEMLSLIPAELADHVHREAEHFLMILSMMEKGLMKHVTEACDEDELEDWLDERDISEPVTEKMEDEPQTLWPDDKEVKKEPPVFVSSQTKEEKCSEEQSTDEPAAAIELPVQEKSNKSDNQEAVSEKKEAVEAKKNKHVPEAGAKKSTSSPSAKAKFKWGGKWPRQLGKKPKE
ncbi:hypothetical protein P22_3722 [Propionispora sp. 2/2-37]|uniref:DUF2935 domain-containing protein n=1 Tax=Propionispora sp. 2/2-37 TaxID=1677858 RepID=UPI0006BB8B0D|nr:DUF2935 domain-containing protein [Propionispora sp. 2/2-37]CUH97591.1 hypothetical protein P22_3722 [Propionispora sp. 2/2-37]